MKLKTSSPGKLLPIGKDKYTNNDMPLQPSSSGNTEPNNPNAGLYIVGGIIVVMVLMLLFWPSVSHAQGKSTAGLKIGDQVPDVTINNILNYKDVDGKPRASAKISDFKGKLLILDFWATWCSPCVTMIPKMDSLQKEFNGQVKFLSLTYQKKEDITEFNEKYDPVHKYNIIQATNEQVLHHLLPHQTLPHFVWVSPDGQILAITGNEDVTFKNISSYLQDRPIQLAEKKDAPIPYDRMRPLLIGDNGGTGANMLYHSVLTSYTDGMKTGSQYFRPDSIKGRKITAWNLDIKLLYKLAYNEGRRTFGNNRIAMELKDPSKVTNSQSGAAFVKWLKEGNGYCYELIVPPALSAKAFQIMQDDLRRLFGQYDVKVELRKTKCLALVRTSDQDKIKSSHQEKKIKMDSFGCDLTAAIISDLVTPLDQYYLQLSPLPVIDETGYSGKIDLSINAHLDSVSAINQALKVYDLQLVEKEKILEILVFKDR